MSPGPEPPPAGRSPEPRRLLAVASRVVRASFVALPGLGWPGFWGPVVRLHYRTGDLLSAGVTGAPFALPAGIGLLYHLRRSISTEPT